MGSIIIIFVNRGSRILYILSFYTHVFNKIGDRCYCNVKNSIPMVKLNVDGSFVHTDGGLARAGMILRDNDGNIIFSACRSILHCSGPLQAELLACQEGLSLALQWSTRPIDIKMDCMDAIKLIKSPTLDRSPHRMIV